MGGNRKSKLSTGAVPEKLIYNSRAVLPRHSYRADPRNPDPPEPIYMYLSIPSIYLSRFALRGCYMINFVVVAPPLFICSRGRASTHFVVLEALALTLPAWEEKKLCFIVYKIFASLTLDAPLFSTLRALSHHSFKTGRARFQSLISKGPAHYTYF